MNGWLADLVSPEVADKVGKCWGLGSDTTNDPGPWEGELRNMWKPTQQSSLWIHGGNLHQSRFYSLTLALQRQGTHGRSPNQLPTDRPPKVTERPSLEVIDHLSSPSSVPYQCIGVSPRRQSAAPAATSTSRISSRTRSRAASSSNGNQAEPCSSCGIVSDAAWMAGFVVGMK
jgi:hypothetical protein